MRIISTKGRRIYQAVFFISLVFLSRTAFSCEKENFDPRLSIKLSAGLSYITGGSVNRHLKTYDNYLSEMTHYGGGETKRLHYSSDLEGELRWEISSKFALGAGIGYFSGKNKSYFEFRGPFPFHVPIDNKQYYTISPRIEVIPLKLGIYYTLPFRSRINLFLSSGLGYYFSRVTLYKIHGSSGYGPEFIIFTKEEKYDLKANGLGCYVGAGFEFSIANNLVIVLEVQGRYARTRLKGTRISSIWELPWVEEEGNLYIGERDLLDEGYGEHCPDLIVSRSRPEGDGFQNIRRAVVDLSGLALRAGIRIKLF